MKIDSDGLIQELDDPDIRQELTLEHMNFWFSRSQEILFAAGDEHDYDVHSVAQSARPPHWDSSREAWVFAYPHVAAEYFEEGTDPHDIRPNEADVLAFPWEEMRGQEFGDTGKTFEEVFPTFPIVFLPKVSVEGIEAINYLDSSREETRQRMEGNQ